MRVFLSHLFTGGILKNDERPWKDAIKLSAVLLIIMVAFNFNYFVTNSMKLGNDEHCLLSLNRAYNNVFCKQVTSFNSNFTSQIDCSKSINKLFFNNESERQTYCLNSEQLTLNESSLSQVYVILFKIFPTISFNGIHKIFVFFKISSILLFCFLLFRIGLSPFYVFLFSILSCFLIYSASLQNSFFSIYSFFIPFFLLFISLMIVYLYLLKKYIYKLIPFGVLIGAYIAFYMNFRTSYSVVVLYSSLILIIFIYYLMYQILGFNPIHMYF
jgi:hypothetical protein